MKNKNKEIERVKGSEHAGWIYWPDDETDDHFFSSVTELIECCKVRGVPVPKEVNGCYEMSISINAEDVLESALEEHHEDARSSIPNAEVEKLQELIDEWCAVQKVITYFQDTSVIVEIDVPINPPADPPAPNSPSE